ncbi:alpha/beta-hydrolase [Curvularia clavata]|uniref:Alpha/beta-hydrolase n=1 Tax=Curvularia clavata TaxID=95742 RepID=A0A9Q8Z5V6_CURCL|nr:alpha/beta-hydrolase [Curvularia clavata]
MSSTTALHTQDTKFTQLGLQKSIVNKEQVCCYTRSLENATDQNPILVLIHGYPQSSYIKGWEEYVGKRLFVLMQRDRWRHFIPLLPSTAPLFVPDLPGYGASAAIPQNDKLSVGRVVLEALKTEVQNAKSSKADHDKIKVVVIGHDRGARVSHHVSVSGVENVDILGVCLIDIVPISTQWQHFASPAAAAAEVTGYFHWPFLANVDLATRMITAFGASNWCREMILHWAGKNTVGINTLKADDALEVYGQFFEQEHTLKASCEDYREGATTDVEREEKSNKEGRKINVPVLLVYSQAGIGSRFTFPDVWREWVGEGVNIQHHGLGDGVGHFGAEEAPKECAEVVERWLKDVLQK